MGPIVPKLGLMVNYMSANQSLNLGDALFSKTQQRVLGLLFGKPDQSFYANEIVRWAGLGKGTVMRELGRMEMSGIVSLSRQGNQTHYQANKNCPVFDELLSITYKTFGIGDAIKIALQPLFNQIEFAFVYGSIAKNEATASSDVDLMIVGKELNYGEVMELLAPVEESLARSINPTLYTLEDFHTKLRAANHFLVRVIEQTKINVIGELPNFKD
jgi:predicted nucleotidyltransferase